MFNFKTRIFDVLEITPPSSPVLKENLDDLFDGSDKLNAVVESLDPATGSYRILLQGKLRPAVAEERQN